MTTSEPATWPPSADALADRLALIVRVHGPRCPGGWVPVWTADDPAALVQTWRVLASHILVSRGAVEIRRTDDDHGLWRMEVRDLLAMPPTAANPPQPPENREEFRP